MKLAKKIVIGAVLTMALLVVGGFIVPLPDATNNFSFKLDLAVTTTLAVAYSASAVLFLVSLRLYKAQMRHAFITLSIGVLLTAISIIQIPILTVLSLTNSFWTASGLEGIPFVLSVVFIYAGVRAFARLVGTHTVLTKVGATLAVITALSLVSTLLPHAQATSSEQQIDTVNAIVVWLGLVALASALIVLQIKQRIGAHYANAMAWLFAALMGSVLAILASLVSTLVSGDDIALVTTLINVATLAIGVMYMRAGYAFTETEDL